MRKVIEEIAAKVCSRCHARHCDKDGCRIGLEGTPPVRVIVDMDCEELQIPVDRKRCDYLFFGEEDRAICVAPVELKSGRVDVSAALEQLERGAEFAHDLLPQGASLRFVPVLAHGKGIHRKDLKRLLDKAIVLRGKKGKVQRIKCGEPLIRALRA